MDAKEAVASVLREGICLVEEDAQEFIEMLEKCGFKIEPIDLREALSGLLAYAEEGCPEGGYIAVLEARAALKGIKPVRHT